MAPKTYAGDADSPRNGRGACPTARARHVEGSWTAKRGIEDEDGEALVTVGVAFESVIDAAKAGAPWAWSVLYRKISGPVTGFFRSRGAAHPESAAGDVFFELSRHIQTFDGNEESFSTLVFAVAYRRLFVEDLHPRRNARSALADRVLDRLNSDIEVVTDETGTNVASSIRAAFEKMLPEERDVVSLRVVAGLTIDQTAKVIGTSTEMVRATQRKGLARVRGPMPPPVFVT